MNEEWRDIKGYDGLYQVSNLGRVRSLDRFNNVGRHRKGVLLSTKNTSRNYETVLLHKKGGIKGFSVHKLVATAFVDNPENKPIINHKDENKKNNNADNLEWVTYKENSNYGTSIERIRISNSIPIISKSKGGFMRWFNSAKEAAEVLKVSNSKISMVAKGKRNHTGGYKFYYANEWRKHEKN